MGFLYALKVVDQAGAGEHFPVLLQQHDAHLVEQLPLGAKLILPGLLPGVQGHAWATVLVVRPAEGECLVVWGTLAHAVAVSDVVDASRRVLVTYVAAGNAAQGGNAGEVSLL